MSQYRLGHIFGFTVFISLIYSLLGEQILSVTPAKSVQTEHPLQVSIYYETLCPDSLNLFENQLLDVLTSNDDPTGSQKSLEDLIDIKLIPYGKALTIETNSKIDKFSFICQHGPLECDGNKLHTCVIKSASKVQEIRPQNLIKFLTCSMKHLITEPSISSTNLTSRIYPTFEFCFQEFELKNQEVISSVKKQVEKCLEDSREASSLLKINGDLTESLNPKLNFVPWVTFNGVWKRRMMEGSLKDLRNVLCQLVIQSSLAAATRSTKSSQEIQGCENYYPSRVTTTTTIGGNFRNPIVEERQLMSIKIPVQASSGSNEMNLLLTPSFDESSPDIRTRDGRGAILMGNVNANGKDRRRFIHTEVDSHHHLGGWRVQQSFPRAPDWRWRRPIYQR